jgi:hypothetical protein
VAGGRSGARPERGGSCMSVAIGCLMVAGLVVAALVLTGKKVRQ